MGDSFNQTPHVDKDQRRAVRPGQRGDPRHNFVPKLVRGDQAELVSRHLHLQIGIPPVTDVDDRTVGGAACAEVCAADQEAGNFLNRMLGRAQPNARQRLLS